MQAALVCYERPLIWRQPPSANDLLRAANLEAALSGFAADASAWADAKLHAQPLPDMTAIRARLEAMQELGAQPKSTRSWAGHPPAAYTKEDDE